MANLSWRDLLNNDFGVPKVITIVILILVAWFFCAWINLVLHEFGHALGGRCVGLRFGYVRLGLLILEHRDGRWNWKWIRGGLSKVFSGEALNYPIHGAALSRRWFLFVAAGPLVTLILTLVSMFAYAVLGHVWLMLPFGSGSAVFVAAMVKFTELFLFTGAGAFLYSIIPQIYGKNDATLLLRFARRTPENDREVANIGITNQGLRGIRPRDWASDLVAAGLGCSDGSFKEALAQYHAFYWALDRGDLETAGVHLKRIKELEMVLPEAVQLALAFDESYYWSRKGELERARAAFGDADEPKDSLRFAWALAKALILLLEQDSDGSRRVAQAALATLRSAPDRPLLPMNYEQLQLLA